MHRRRFALACSVLQIVLCTAPLGAGAGPVLDTRDAQTLHVSPNYNLAPTLIPVLQRFAAARNASVVVNAFQHDKDDWPLRKYGPAYLQEPTVPDVLLFYGGPQLTPYTPYLRNLTGLWLANRWRDQMHPLCRSVCTIAGASQVTGATDTNVCLPLGVAVFSVAYRKSILANASLAAPTTWPALLGACRTLKAAGVAPFGVGAGNAQYLSLYALYDHVSMRADLGAHAQMLAGNLSYLSPAGRRPFELLQEMAAAGCFPAAAANMTLDDLTAQFTQGRIAMILTTPGTVVNSAVRADIGVVPFPIVNATNTSATPAAPTGTIVSVSSLFVPQRTLHPDLADALLTFTYPTTARGTVPCDRQLQLAADPVVQPFVAILNATDVPLTQLTGVISSQFDARLSPVLSAFFRNPAAPLDSLLSTLEVARQEVFLALAARPVILPASGRYRSPLVLNLTTATVRGVVHYTIDGTPPYEQSPATTPGGEGRTLALQGRVVVRAITLRDGLRRSEEATAVYFLEVPATGGTTGGGFPRWAVVLLPVVGGALLAGLALLAWRATANHRRLQALLNEKRVAEDTAEAIATMQLEKLDYLLQIQRPTRIQHAFQRILQSLYEYRNFLPTSVLVAANSSNGNLPDDSGSDAVDVLPRVPSVITSVSSASTPTHARHSRSAHHPSHSSATTSTANTSAYQRAPTNSRALAKRTVTYVVLNVRDFHQLIPTGTRATVEYHQLILRTLLPVFATHGGIAEPFQGDRLTVSWNAVTYRADHQARACTAALQASRLIPHPSPPSAVAPGTASASHLSIGIATGPAMVGNLGITGMKRFAILGGCVNAAHLLQRLNRTYGTCVLAASGTVDGLPPVFLRVLLDRVAFGKLQPEPFDLWGLVAHQESAQGDEWMYELSRAESSNPFTEFNSAMCQLLRTRRVQDTPQPTALIPSTFVAWFHQLNQSPARPVPHHTD